MRRVQAILVILALLATPLALLARADDSTMADCNGMCCLPHGSHHHSPIQHPATEPDQSGMACHHGAPNHLMDCTMKSGQHQMDYGLLAPLPPARPSALASVDVPKLIRIPASEFPGQDLSAGFLEGPFQPPRN